MEIKTGKMYKIKEKAFNYFTVISIPGVPGIFTGNNIFFNIFWTLLMLGLFGVGFWNIALSIKDYYNYDVITNIKTRTPENVTFPAITICTNSMFRQDYYINGSFNRSENLILEGFGGLLFDAEFKTYNKSKQSWDALSVKEKLEFFFIIELNQNSFCLRFNAAKNKKTKELFTSSTTRDHFTVSFRKQIKYGDDNDNSTLSFFDQRASFYVYITDNNLDSFKKLEFLELDIPKNGYTFKIDVASVQTKLPEPYNRCKESPYNQMNCIEECIHNQIRSVYNCTLPGTLFENSDLEACPYKEKAYQSYEQNEFNDYCKIECPHDDCNSKKLSYDYYDDSSLFTYELGVDWIKNNDLLVLFFYIRDLNYMDITQIPKTDRWTFVNNIGGGLFMGLAFPNFVEFLQFVSDILMTIVD